MRKLFISALVGVAIADGMILTIELLDRLLRDQFISAPPPDMILAWLKLIGMLALAPTMIFGWDANPYVLNAVIGAIGGIIIGIHIPSNIVKPPSKPQP